MAHAYIHIRLFIMISVCLTMKLNKLARSKKANYAIGFFAAMTQTPLTEIEKQDIRSFIDAFSESNSEKIKELQNLIMELE